MEFNVGNVGCCPPPGSEEVARTLFRAIKGRNPKPADFISLAELGRASKEQCKPWGLSVWPTLEAAHHGRKVVPAMRRKKIVEVTVGKADGRYLPTPSHEQPEHCTFWKNVNSDLSTTSVIVFDPHKNQAND